MQAETKTTEIMSLDNNKIFRLNVRFVCRTICFFFLHKNPISLQCARAANEEGNQHRLVLRSPIANAGLKPSRDKTSSGLRRAS